MDTKSFRYYSPNSLFDREIGGHACKARRSSSVQCNDPFFLCVLKYVLRCVFFPTAINLKFPACSYHMLQKLLFP